VSVLPFEGSSQISLPMRRHRRSGHLSWDFVRFRVLCAARYRAVGLPSPTSAFIVSDSPSWSSTRCRPPALSRWVHPPVRFVSLQSLSRIRPPGCAEHLPWASVPHRDTSLRSLLTRASPARYVPSSTFRTSSTAFSSADRAGLFHPATTSRVRSSGSYPREKPNGLFARRCPHVVHTASLPSELTNGSRNQCPPSGPCSARESVASNGGLDQPPPDPLLSFSFLGFSFTHRETTFIASPTTAFRGPRRSTRARPDLLLRARLPRPRFSA